jgi:hypothetical protein
MAAFKAVKVKTMGIVDGYTAFQPESALPIEAQFVREGAYFCVVAGQGC